MVGYKEEDKEKGNRMREIGQGWKKKGRREHDADLLLSTLVDATDSAGLFILRDDRCSIRLHLLEVEVIVA